MSIPTADLSSYQYAPVMNYPAPGELKVFDFTKGYDPDYIQSFEWGIGKYNEHRAEMYKTELFGGERNIHVGIDIWTKASRPVFSFYDGKVVYKQNNEQPGDYGPTLVLCYEMEFITLYALYGHLSKMTLENIQVGDKVNMGQQIGTLGTEEENGGWVPHLHFQLSVEDPGQADMPGVVAKNEIKEAIQTYPDPRKVLGPLY